MSQDIPTKIDVSVDIAEKRKQCHEAEKQIFHNEGHLHAKHLSSKILSVPQQGS